MVRVEGESRKSKPRRRGADLGSPPEGSRRTKRLSAKSDSTPGFRRPKIQGVPKIKGRVHSSLIYGRILIICTPN
jgi:hypothetical protein